MEGLTSNITLPGLASKLNVVSEDKLPFPLPLLASVKHKPFTLHFVCFCHVR